MTAEPSTSRMGVVLVVVLAAAALLVSAPTDGNFWWSDAPRHALNGAFVRDFIAAFPVDDPRRWAVDYYLKYPALTILFYPPLFYVIEAAVYAVLGVSHFAAQFTVWLFVPVLMVAAYRVARRLLPRWSAVGAMLLVAGAPEVAFWARQVMLDVPAYALAVAALWFLIRFGERGRTRDLGAVALCVLGAAWIKLNAVFVLPVLAVALVLARGWSVLRERRLLAIAGLTLVAFAPLLWLTWQFGSANLQSVSGRPSDLPRWSVEAWVFYARQLPAYLGVPGLVAALVGAASLWRLSWAASPQRWLASALGLWFVAGYIFFSIIGVREPRHGLLMVMPLAVLATAAWHMWLPSRVAQAGALLLGVVTMMSSLVWRPAPHVDGYREVADYVAAHAPPNAVVLFHGTRDGNFVFNIRARAGRTDLTVLRSDKLLLRLIAGERARGVRQTDLSEADIAQMIADLGVNVVVMQPGFWADIRQMARFEHIVDSDQFARAATFQISGNAPHQDVRIDVRTPRYPVIRRNRSVVLEMPMVRDVFRGELGEP